MSAEIYELNCPFCDKLYKLPRDKVIKHVGKFIHCRKCGKPFSIPALPPDEPAEEPIVEVPIVPPELEPPAVEETVVGEPPVPEPPVVEQSVAEPVVEEPPVKIPFATAEAFEPPPLTGYDEVPGVDVPGQPLASFHAEHFEETFAVPVSEPLSEPPDPLSYFSTEVVADDVVKAIEPSPEPSEAGAAETSPLEAPLPQLPPVPVSPPSPPKPRRAERTSVVPVFDAQPDEPQPRRRGRFGLRSPGDDPVEAAATPPLQVPDAPINIRSLAAIPATAPVETIGQTPAVETEPMENAGPVESLEPGAGDAEPALPAKEGAPILASTRVPPMAASENVLGVWLSIRRSVALLSVMSVVIALVLIAILLTLLGIIPKK